MLIRKQIELEIIDKRMEARVEELMNQYTQFLNQHWQLLGALQWFWFKRKGLVVLCLQENRVYFRFYNELDEHIKELCDRNSPQANVIVRFEDGKVIAFQPPE
ncbi:MAG: hypothetical protein KA714_30530 [Limnoraphis sp. WC205]|jgi:hypothetical protein|nr:hypothetical protein [Limnoraphis sp. WC205]